LIELLVLPLLQRDFLFFWSAVLHSLLLLLVTLEGEDEPSRRVVAMVQLLAGRLVVPGAPGFVEVVFVVVVVAVVGVPMPTLVCGHWSRCWA
jgi:hypothetical protein